MQCPSCENHETRVLQTRVFKYQPRWIRRFRICSVCEHRFNTLELPAEDLDVDTDDDNGTD